MTVEIQNLYQRPSGAQLEDYRKTFHATPSWETMEGIIVTRTENRERRKNNFKKYRQAIREYYEAWFNVVTGKGYRRLNRWNQEYINDEHENQLKEMNPILNMVRSALVPPEI